MSTRIHKNWIGLRTSLKFKLEKWKQEREGLQVPQIWTRTESLEFRYPALDVNILRWVPKIQSLSGRPWYHKHDQPLLSPWDGEHLEWRK